MVGTFDGYHGGLKHIQSFLLIINKEISEYYYDKLSKSKFMNMSITNEQVKMSFIISLEVGLCNELIKSNKYKIRSLYEFYYPKEIYQVLKSLDYEHNYEFRNRIHNNQAFWIGCIKNIFKTGYIDRSLVSINYFKKQIKLNNFEKNLFIYFHLYKPFVNYFNFFYNNKKYDKNLNNYKRTDRLVFINNVIQILEFNEKFKLKNNISKKKIKYLHF